MENLSELIITLLSCTFYPKFSFCPTTIAFFFKGYNPNQYGFSGSFLSLRGNFFEVIQKLTVR